MENLKALVEINDNPVAMFYQMGQETKSEMHQRILDIINYRYEFVKINIIWQ
jgi:hypothetical protein